MHAAAEFFPGHDRVCSYLVEQFGHRPLETLRRTALAERDWSSVAAAASQVLKYSMLVFMVEPLNLALGLVVQGDTDGAMWICAGIVVRLDAQRAEEREGAAERLRREQAFMRVRSFLASVGAIVFDEAAPSRRRRPVIDLPAELMDAPGSNRRFHLGRAGRREIEVSLGRELSSLEVAKIESDVVAGEA